MRYIWFLFSGFSGLSRLKMTVCNRWKNAITGRKKLFQQRLRWFGQERKDRCLDNVAVLLYPGVDVVVNISGIMLHREMDHALIPIQLFRTKDKETNFLDCLALEKTWVSVKLEQNFSRREISEPFGMTHSSSRRENIPIGWKRISR